MTVGFRLALIWIAGCVLAVIMAMNFLPVSFVDGHYVPAGDAVDHHFVEYMFVLAATLAGVHAFREPTKLAPSMGLGLACGFAVAFHNGLFILQLRLPRTCAM